MMSLVWIASFCVLGIRATLGMRGYSGWIPKTSDCWLALFNSDGNLIFGASTAVRDNYSEVNTQYFLSRPKGPRMSRVASLPGTDTRKCNSNMMQPIQSLRPTDHAFQMLPHKTSNHASTQSTAHNFNCFGHSTSAVELIDEFTFSLFLLKSQS